MKDKHLKRKLTQEEIENTNYPLCTRCEHYTNLRSSIFGDCWECGLKSPICYNVSENEWNIEEEECELIYDCGMYEEGEPTIYTLG